VVTIYGSYSRGATPSSAPTRTARTTTAARAPTARVSASSSTSSRPAAAGASTARRPVVSAGGARKAPSVPDETLQALTTQMSDMRLSVEALEKERDFYFGKVSRVICSCAVLVCTGMIS
jgi:RP/EB family microtubule-associated protein